MLYGAAEFSRDADVAIHATTENLLLLQSALSELQASVIAVPQFELRHLEKGHAIHFRCEHADVSGLRIDIMSCLRGVAGFAELWPRRTTLFLPGQDGRDLEVDVMALPDLVASKKTQRDKDWPMLRRLVEANYFEHRDAATEAQIMFWLRELRTAELLVECVALYPDHAAKEKARPAIMAAIRGDMPMVEGAIAKEETEQRRLDREYWAPLRAELQSLRRQQRS